MDRVPYVCPKCSSNNLKTIGIGTEQLKENLQNLFPKANIAQIDRDTTKTKTALNNYLEKITNNEYQILIGTQMLSKGLDFDNVTLVGILSADMILNFPDFKSFETTFQLITQVSGRAGRSDKEGNVISWASAGTIGYKGSKKKTPKLLRALEYKDNAKIIFY